MAKIFLCHANEDKLQVREVYQRLKAEGFEPWLDEEALVPGQLWDQEIRRALRSSDFILIFFSQNSVAKRGVVQREMKLALEAWEESPEGQIHTIPVRLDNCQIPDQFRKFQWVDLFGDTGWERLIRAIRLGLEQRQLSHITRTLSPKLATVMDTRKNYYNVGLVGGAKSGKSTLFNASIQQDIAPVKAVPSNVMIKCMYSNDKYMLQIYNEDNNTEAILEYSNPTSNTICKITKIMEEQIKYIDNNNNAEDASPMIKLDLYGPWREFPKGLSLVDTPMMYMDYNRKDKFELFSVFDSIFFIMDVCQAFTEEGEETIKLLKYKGNKRIFLYSVNVIFCTDCANCGWMIVWGSTIT